MSSRKQKILAAVLIVIALIGMAAGAAFGYLSAQTGPVQNTFTPDQETDPSISENFDGTQKTNVKVKVGDPGYAVYVRAAIVVTWEDGSNNVLPQMPEADVDYTMSLKVDTLKETSDDQNKWFYNPDDGFYYYKEMVNSGETEALIENCKQLKASPDSNYKLHVEIIAQTIQALGTTDGDNPVPAITDAWGIRVDGNKKLYNTGKALAGDGWIELSTRYGVDDNALSALNGRTTSDTLYEGELVYLPNLD